MIYKDVFPHKIVAPNNNRTYGSVNYPHEFPKIAYAQFDIQTGKGLLGFVEFDFEKMLSAISDIDKNKDEYEIEDKIRNICAELENKHDYLFFFVNGKVERLLLAEEKSEGNPDYDRLEASLDYLTSVVKLQSMYKTIFNFYQTRKSDISLPEKFDIVLFQYPELSKTVIRKTITVVGKGDNGRVSEAYIIESLEEMLFFEFMEMLRLDIRVKRCKLCGRYFILPDKRRHEFCERVYKDDKTCKDVGSKIVFNDKTHKDEVLKLYLRQYNRLYSRMYRAEGKEPHERSGKDMTRAEFEAWAEKAKKAAEDYKAGRIPEGEFLDSLENSNPFTI